MKLINTKKAFSLIELSIVVLVIGILIAGVLSGSRLITKSKIKVAQTLTQSSPVSSIKDLAVWYDTVSDASFNDLEEEDGSSVTAWNDINPQIKDKNNASSSGTQAQYIENAINGLPILRFSNPTASGYRNSTLQLGSNISVFIVAKRASLTPFSRIINNNLYFFVGSSFGGDIYSAFMGNGSSWNGTNNFSTILTMDKFYILSVIIESGSVTGYQDGSYADSHGSDVKAVSTGIDIGYDASGQDQSWVGDIGEIIIFNRSVKTEERKSVEKYLSQKWGIAVSS